MERDEQQRLRRVEGGGGGGVGEVGVGDGADWGGG